MATQDNRNNSWNEWSKHILKELERLNTNYSSINDKIDSIKQDLHQEIYVIKNDITKVKAMQYTLNELKTWKEEVNNSLTPAQMSQISDKLQNLETFKTQAITVFLVVQALVGIALTLLKFFG